MASSGEAADCIQLSTPIFSYPLKHVGEPTVAAKKHKKYKRPLLKHMLGLSILGFVEIWRGKLAASVEEETLPM